MNRLTPRSDPVIRAMHRRCARQTAWVAAAGIALLWLAGAVLLGDPPPVDPPAAVYEVGR